MIANPDQVPIPNNEVLRLDYEKTNDYISLLADIRFKLLAIVPTITGATIAILTINRGNADSAFILGIFGLAVTLGIIFYELRNSQLYDAAIFRAKHLERLLKMPRLSPFGCTPKITYGGLFNERPLRPELFGLLPIWHDRGLALIYSATIGGWSYIIVYSYSQLKQGEEFHVLSNAISPFKFSIAIALIIGTIFLIEFHRIERRTKGMAKVDQTNIENNGIIKLK